LCGGQHTLNDGPKADAWEELAARSNAFDGLVAFFIDSLSRMVGRVEELLGLQQRLHNSH
jgi:hypothetical protein